MTGGSNTRAARCRRSPNASRASWIVRSRQDGRQPDSSRSRWNTHGTEHTPGASMGINTANDSVPSRGRVPPGDDQPRSDDLPGARSGWVETRGDDRAFGVLSSSITPSDRNQIALIRMRSRRHARRDRDDRRRRRADGTNRCAPRLTATRRTGTKRTMTKRTSSAARVKAPLTDLENEVMRVVWDKGPCSVETVYEVVSKKRDLKETTVRTLLRRLEQKGYLGPRIRGPRVSLHRDGSAAESGRSRRAPNHRSLLSGVGRRARQRHGGGQGAQPRRAQVDWRSSFASSGRGARDGLLPCRVCRAERC